MTRRAFIALAFAIVASAAAETAEEEEPPELERMEQ